MVAIAAEVLDPPGVVEPLVRVNLVPFLHVFDSNRKATINTRQNRAESLT